MAQQCAGYNLYAGSAPNGGQLGDGTYTSRSNPVYVNTTNTFVAISAGTALTVGILTNGSAMSWGYNGYGALGNGSSSGNAYSPGRLNISSTKSPLLGTVNNTASGSEATVNFTNVTPGVTYIWGVSVFDGSSVTLSSSWVFTGLDITLPTFTAMANQS